MSGFAVSMGGTMVGSPVNKQNNKVHINFGDFESKTVSLAPK